MGNNIKGLFADQDSYTLSALIATARSNQADLNVIIVENDQIKASSVSFQSQGLTTNPANPVPVVAQVAVTTVGNSENPPERIKPVLQNPDD